MFFYSLPVNSSLSIFFIGLLLGIESKQKRRVIFRILTEKRCRIDVKLILTLIVDVLGSSSSYQLIVMLKSVNVLEHIELIR